MWTIALGMLLSTMDLAWAGPKHTHGIPPGHLPPPGQCRVWYPGAPPGHQPPPAPCAVAFRQAPPGSWVVERPPARVEIIRIYEIARPTGPRRTVVYAASGPMLRIEVSGR